jgi:O-antigen/teichoic acid export membrane protein
MSDLAPQTDSEPPLVCQKIMPSDRHHHCWHLTSGHVLARNTFWNLVGSIAPMAAAVFCIPVLVRQLGTDRFGILTLIWTVIGYGSLFDLGVGRALTQLVAKKLGTGDEDEIPSLAWTSFMLLLGLGLAGFGVVVVLAPWMVRSVLHVPAMLQTETVHCFYCLGLSIPAVVFTAGLRGLLEAKQKFAIVNALRIPMVLFTFVGPLLVLPFSRKLVPIVAMLATGRLISWAAHLILCLRVIPALRTQVTWHLTNVIQLLRFGGWMTVTNVIGPLMVSVDRFLIGALLTVTAVAYYTTPYELITKLWLIPTAVLGVMFPAFSTSFVQDPSRTTLLYSRTLKYIFLLLFPLVLVVVVFAKDGMRLWLGNEFAIRSVPVLQWLAVGVFLNCLAQVPFAVIQGVGRPDLTAKVHALELPAYLLALWFLTRTFGIEGAAIAWTVRATVDALLLFVLARRFTSFVAASQHWRTIPIIAGALVTLAAATIPQGLMVRSIFLLATILTFVLLAWFLVLSPDERRFAQQYF